MRFEQFIMGVYLLLCFWLIPKISLVRHTNLRPGNIRLLFAFKLFVGFACAFYFQRISSSVDYNGYNTEGKIQYDLLLSNPALFFTDFKNDINTYGLGKLFNSQDSFWAYLRFNLLYKLIALADLLTKGDFYLNTLLFSSIVFFGHIALYRVFSEIYQKQKLKILCTCFFLPSVLLYTSCIHKDGIIFVALAFVSLVFNKILHAASSVKFRHWGVFISSLFCIFLFRNYLLIALIPAIAIALLCKMFPYKKRVVWAGCYSICITLFFLSGYVHSSLNLPAAVIQRKADFAALEGGTTNIAMNELYPTLQSFVSNLPQAINHFFFRPYLWEFSQPSVILAALELFAYQLIFLAFIFFRKRSVGGINNFNLFGISLVINMMLIIGYTIPNIGAIVRYRSIFWIWLIGPLACNIDWQKLFSFHKTKKAAA